MDAGERVWPGEGVVPPAAPPPPPPLLPPPLALLQERAILALCFCVEGCLNYVTI
jgi:hypothetical protein